MGIPFLKISNRWKSNNTAEEADWDAIRDPVVEWAGTIANDIKQIGLDLNGSSYDFNGDGKATQTSSVIGRLDALDLSQSKLGAQNLAVDLTSQAICKLTSADTTALSSTNIGYASLPSFDDAGGADAAQLETISITSDISVTLTGAHWGLGTLGDFSDVPIWMYLINVGSSTVRLGLSLVGGIRYASSSNCKTVTTTVTSRGHILVNDTVSSDSPVVELGVIYADFDDTGNAGGEDYWTLQNAVGDIQFTGWRSLKAGEFHF